MLRTSVIAHRLVILLAERAAAGSSLRENVDLNRPQRETQSALPSGNWPQRMDMIWKNADGDSFKLAALMHDGIGPANTFDVTDQQIARAVGERQREDE
jgi:hypothetical protein